MEELWRRWNPSGTGEEMSFIRVKTLSRQGELKAEKDMAWPENRVGSENGFVLGP